MKKIAIVVALLALLALVIGVGLAENSTTSDAPISIETITTPGSQAPGVIQTNYDTQNQAEAQHSNAWIWILLIISVFLTLPWLLNTAWNMWIRKQLLGKVEQIQDENKKLEYYKILLSSFPERKGLSRFSLMVAITLVIGAIVLYLVFTNGNNELVKTIVAVLTGALTSIVGFYFGGRAAEPSEEPPATPPAGTTTPEGTTPGGT